MPSEQRGCGQDQPKAVPQAEPFLQHRGAPYRLQRRQESAAGSDKNQQPAAPIVCLRKSFVAQEALYFQRSPAGSSQPRCDLGRGEGAGQNRLAEKPSKTRGEGDRLQRSFSSNRGTETCFRSPKNG